MVHIHGTTVVESLNVPTHNRSVSEGVEGTVAEHIYIFPMAAMLPCRCHPETVRNTLLRASDKYSGH